MSVHNLRHERMQPGPGSNDVYVGRAGQGQEGYFGNPFSQRDGMGVEESIERFDDYAKDRMYRDPEYRERVKALYGKRLFCFCVDRFGDGPCHAKSLESLARRENA